MSETGRRTSCASGSTVPDVAERLDVPVTKVHQLLREGGLAAAAARRRAARSRPCSSDGDAVVKGLTGVLTLLHDGGYDDEAAIRWLHTPDESPARHPGRRRCSADRGREVKRRAQALPSDAGHGQRRTARACRTGPAWSR